MRIINFELDWNNKIQCDYFVDITIIPTIEVSEIVGINIDEKLVCTAKCIQKIETKIDMLKDMICLCATGYNKETTAMLLKKMHAAVNDWNTQKIYIYGYTRKYSIDDKLSVDSRLIKYL